jgi:hypothetical protein
MMLPCELIRRYLDLGDTEDEKAISSARPICLFRCCSSQSFPQGAQLDDSIRQA